MNMLTRSGIRYSAELPHYAIDADDAIAWCEEQYGPPSLLNGRWYPLEFTIQFADKKDRNWYLLRWGK